MLRRKPRSILISSEENPAVPIAFEDRTGGVSGAKRRKRSDLETDEKKLEEIVLGCQPSWSELVSIEEDDCCYDSEKNTSKTKTTPTVMEPVPVWEDEDDEKLVVNIASDKGLRKLRKAEDETEITGHEYTKRLRTQFQKLSQQPLWSLPDTNNKADSSSSDSDDDDDGEDDVLKACSSSLLPASRLLSSSTSRQLPGGVLKIKKLKDANISKPAEAVLQSVEFHPSSNIVLTAGMNKRLSLFQVDGTDNPHIQSVYIKRFPIQTAHFSNEGQEVVMAADKHWYYVYDIISGRVTMINEIKGHNKERFAKFSVSPDSKLLAFIGKDGYIVLVSNKTKQWVADLKMNGSVSSLAFTPDSTKLLSTGSDGDVYVWDLRSMDCIHRFTDDGCVRGTSLSVSPNGQFVATGSSSGVVNIYDQTCLIQPKPRPLKSVMNLTTSIGNMCFNPSNEILAISSREKKTAIRLVHVPSMSVYANWPASHVKVDYVYSMDFSSDSRYMLLGNARGKAPLFRLNHFHNSNKTT